MKPLTPPLNPSNKTMPILRVDNWLLFPGRPEKDRPMTLAERLAWKLGIRKVL